MGKKARFSNALLIILKRERHLISNNPNDKLLDVLCLNSHMVLANNSMLIGANSD